MLGANWALRALHPCGEGINIVPKVPDGALTDSVVLERRDEFDVKFPSVHWGPDKQTTWNLLIIQLPVVKTPIVALAYKDDVNREYMQQAWTAALDHFGDASMSTTAGYDKDYVYPSWKAVGGLKDPPVCITIMNMANLDKDIAAISMSKEFLTIRRTYEGTTFDFDANALTDKGRLVSGQIASDLSKENLDIIEQIVIPEKAKPKDMLFDKTYDAVAQTQSIYVYADIPLVETELTQMDSKVRQAEAKCGDYAPCRFWEPVFTNSTAKDVAAFSNLDPNGKDAGVGAPKTNINIPLIGWGIKLSFWLSIHNTSSVRIKRREGLEMNTAKTSHYSPFSTPAYPRDDRAQTVFREFCRQQEHSFDANFNSLGGMLSNIVSSLGGVLGSLNLPIVSDLAKTLTPVLKGVADALPI